MSYRNDLLGNFSDNWRGRSTRVGSNVDIIVGAIAFMADVQIAQVQLNALGFPCGVPDGKLGAQTAAALKSFQGFEKLPATGSLDAATKKRLYERTAFMGLTLPGGTPIVPPASTPGTPSSDVLDQLKKDIGTYAPPELPDAWKSTPAVPGVPAVPAVPAVPGVPGAKALPTPPPSAVVEKKILGMKPVVAYSIGGVVVAGAVVGAAFYMKSRKGVEAAATFKRSTPAALSMPGRGAISMPGESRKGISMPDYDSEKTLATG